jgi:hypothetical protein
MGHKAEAQLRATDWPRKRMPGGVDAATIGLIIAAVSRLLTLPGGRRP